MASTGTNMAQSNPDLQKAVKYCPACSIIVFPAKRRGDSVAVTVADNGPGLPDGNPQRLFDPFRRGKRETAVSGTGLGLAICRTIARVHGAEIFATDSVWGGAGRPLRWCSLTCRWPNSMTKMQLTMQTMCLQLKPAAAVVPHFRQEVENDR